MRSKRMPCALTIAGSDSGGGAGIQADLKTFASLGVHGTSAITCVTAQNPRRVLAIQPCQPEIVRQQLEAITAELKPHAVKTGMLFSTEIIRTVVHFLQSRAGQRLSRRERALPLVVDPVMIATSGARLLKDSAIKLLAAELLPLATLITPNLDEARVLVNRRLRCVEDMRWAARQIHGLFGCAVLLKGGHLRGSSDAADVFYDGETELLLTAPFVKNVSTHGTGCTYAAAITAFLAQGIPLPESVKLSKTYITEAIARSNRVQKHSVLNHSAAGEGRPA